MPSPPDSVGEDITFSGWLFVRSPVRSSGQILLPRYLMNGLSNLDETCSEYPIAPIDDLIKFWRSKVNVAAGRGEGIHVEVHLLVLLLLCIITSKFL